MVTSHVTLEMKFKTYLDFGTPNLTVHYDYWEYDITPESEENYFDLWSESIAYMRVAERSVVDDFDLSDLVKL